MKMNACAEPPFFCESRLLQQLLPGFGGLQSFANPATNGLGRGDSGRSQARD